MGQRAVDTRNTADYSTEPYEYLAGNTHRKPTRKAEPAVSGSAGGNPELNR
jgi:hypothetical protein